MAKAYLPEGCVRAPPRTCGRVARGAGVTDAPTLVAPRAKCVPLPSAAAASSLLVGARARCLRMSASEVGPTTRPPMATELYAAGRLIGAKCFDENLDWMKCRQAKGEGPSACAGEGEAVHRCVYGLYKDIASKAATQFKDYAHCLNWYDLDTPSCKKEQQTFERAYYAASS